jgi:hypothetical protein
MLAGLMHMSVAQAEGRLQGGCQRVAHAAAVKGAAADFLCAHNAWRASQQKEAFIFGALEGGNSSRNPDDRAEQTDPPTLSLSFCFFGGSETYICVTGNQPPLLLFCESFTSARTHTLTG